MNKINQIKKICNLISFANILNIGYTQNINIKKIKNDKGIIGKIIENIFQIKNKNDSDADWNDIGLELKTIPLNKKLNPKELTKICIIKKNNIKVNWEKSQVYKKIKNILWIPYEGSVKIAISKKRILIPFIYTLTNKEEKIIKNEWEIIIESFLFCNNNNFFIKEGEFLKLNKNKKKSYITIYLKKKFTKKILKKINYKKKIKKYRGRDLNSHN